MMFRLAVFLFLPAVALAGEPKPPSIVTRAEAMATAERYRTLKWEPTLANVFHSRDANGIRVDTPDVRYKPASGFSGFWKPGLINVGMPYKWDGYDTQESFLIGIGAGKAAGDVCTPEKRRLLEAGTSAQAVGIDCSGLVSRCWNLPRAVSTRTITALCDPIPDLKDLRPGDILNTHNSHVFLFKKWSTPDRSWMIAYTTGTPPLWAVRSGPIRTQQMAPLGYTAWRYRGMRD